MTGLNESTVRVHLFRAARKLRGLLGGTAVMAARVHLARRTAVRLLSGRARRRRRSIRRQPSTWPIAPPCGSRYAELSAFMDTLRDDGDAEADAVFTPERLRAQQQQIAQAARAGRPRRARDQLSGPRRRGATSPARRSRTAPRWLAAAAAAGLFIGVAARRIVPVARRTLARSDACRASATTASRASRLTPVATRGTGAGDVADDDAFLSDLEVALERPHTRELHAVRRSSRRTCATSATPAVVGLSHLPQRPRPQARRRRHARRELSQRDRRSDQGRRLHATAPAG